MRGYVCLHVHAHTVACVFVKETEGHEKTNTDKRRQLETKGPFKNVTCSSIYCRKDVVF